MVWNWSMASPTIEQENDQHPSVFPTNIRFIVPLLPRRCAAWVIEVSMVAASALIPYGVGVYAQSQGWGDPVPLSPVLAETEEAIAQTLALPPRSVTEEKVPPLTNLFWWTALISPIAVSSWQLYLLGKTGQTLPKRWLGVRVVRGSGEPPGILRAFVREGIGRYGMPVGLAYLIWRYTGAFPDLGVLCGLSGLMLVTEGGMLVLGVRRRTWHDRLADTYVVDAKWQFSGQPQPYQVEVQTNWETRSQATDSSRKDPFTTIVLTAHKLEVPKFNLLQWMREHPGITLLSAASVGLIAILGTFVGIQIYIQDQANHREFQQQSNEVFLALVDQLSSPVYGSLEERQAAILALAQLDDPRATPMLVDLLAQEENLDLIKTLQQGLVSSGAEALPYLRRLNQSLRSDLESQEGEETTEEKLLLAQRLQATQGAIAKLLALYSGQIHDINLERTYLVSLPSNPASFSLKLENIDLSGSNFRGAILSHANLKSSRFYGAGEDERFGTFDDWISDLSGADLKEANLTQALFSHALLNRTNLIRAMLNQGNFSKAQLVGANLSSAELVGANFQQAVLQEASLTGAEMAEANFHLANLQAANLGQVQALGADFSFANLAQSTWQEANLSQGNFSNANLYSANLTNTDLTDANLKNAQLQNANLRNANLSSADLRGANLDGANFQGVELAIAPSPDSNNFLEPTPIASSAAKIAGVNFAKVKNLSPQQIELICTQGGRHPQCQ